MTDRLKFGSKVFFKRQDRWKHNSFQGHVAMLKANMQSIIQSKTTTYEAKTIAQEIYSRANDLAAALKTRVD